MSAQNVEGLKIVKVICKNFVRYCISFLKRILGRQTRSRPEILVEGLTFERRKKIAKTNVQCRILRMRL